MYVCVCVHSDGCDERTNAIKAQKFQQVSSVEPIIRPTTMKLCLVLVVLLALVTQAWSVNTMYRKIVGKPYEEARSIIEHSAWRDHVSYTFHDGRRRGASDFSLDPNHKIIVLDENDAVEGVIVS